LISSAPSSKISSGCSLQNEGLIARNRLEDRFIAALNEKVLNREFGPRASGG
jgi:hypothetical protein